MSDTDNDLTLSDLDAILARSSVASEAQQDVPRLVHMIRKLVEDIKVLEYTNGQLLRRLAGK